MKFYLETYGCQMNVADSEVVCSILAKAGWDEASTIDEADLILFNTCSVRQHAENRVLGRIANEKHRKLLKPNLKFVVLGCMAQRMGEELKEIEAGVDFVIGVDQYQSLPHILENEFSVNTDISLLQDYSDTSPIHHGESCAFVTIMRGCNNYCTYCIVPYVRGRERSLPCEKIISEVQRCGEMGLKDVTLLGQNVNSYNAGEVDFPLLLKALAQIESILRLRFITSHPKDLSQRLIDVMASNHKICNHIHLPLQSGDNAILAAMNRNYTIEHYASLVHNLREAIPDIAITTDLIAGFPGETEQQFNNTLMAMKSIGFDYAFCFRYSDRPGTRASNFSDKTTDEVGLDRLKRMIELQRKITLEKFKAQIGKTVEVYVEGLSKKDDSQVSGKTRDFKIAVLTGNKSDIGTLKSGKVINATAGTLICE
jgi:tRNA-2-methylthio-N6-dimethylallyladenosine synthase